MKRRDLLIAGLGAWGLKGAEMRANLQGAVGRTGMAPERVPGYTLAESLPITGDSGAHEIRWQSAPMSDYQYEGVSLRLEWTDGTLYGLLASLLDSNPLDKFRQVF